MCSAGSELQLAPHGIHFPAAAIDLKALGRGIQDEHHGHRLPYADSRNHSAIRETIVLQTPTVFDLLTIGNCSSLPSIKKLLKGKLFSAHYCASQEGESDVNKWGLCCQELIAVWNRKMYSKSGLMHVYRTHRYLILITGIDRF